MEDKSWCSELAATFQAGLNRTGGVLPPTETVKQASHACTLQIYLLISRRRRKRYLIQLKPLKNMDHTQGGFSFCEAVQAVQ